LGCQQITNNSIFEAERRRKKRREYKAALIHHSFWFTLALFQKKGSSIIILIWEFKKIQSELTRNTRYFHSKRSTKIRLIQWNLTKTNIHYLHLPIYPPFQAVLNSSSSNNNNNNNNNFQLLKLLLGTCVQIAMQEYPLKQEQSQQQRMDIWTPWLRSSTGNMHIQKTATITTAETIPNWIILSRAIQLQRADTNTICIIIKLLMYQLSYEGNNCSWRKRMI